MEARAARFAAVLAQRDYVSLVLAQFVREDVDVLRLHQPPSFLPTVVLRTGCRQLISGGLDSSGVLPELPFPWILDELVESSSRRSDPARVMEPSQKVLRVALLESRLIDHVVGIHATQGFRLCLATPRTTGTRLLGTRGQHRAPEFAIPVPTASGLPNGYPFRH